MVKIYKTIHKDLISTIKNNFKRYISIVLITLLGVCFFVGMKTSSPVLKENMTNYFEEYNYMDIQVTSSIGITNEEFEKIKAVPGVSKAEYNYTGVLSVPIYNKKTKNNESYNFELQSYNKDNIINLINITDGRNILNDDECVLDASFRKRGFDIGDYIEINADFLKKHKFKIVGFARSPIYISYSKATSILLGGSIDYFGYIDESNFIPENDNYTSVYIKVNTTSPAFTDQYQKDIFNVQNEIKKVIKPLFDEQKNKYIEEKTNLYNDAEIEFNEQSSKLYSELESAKTTIEKAKNDISDAEGKLLSDDEIDLYLTNLKNSLDIAKMQMDSQFKLIDNTKKILSVAESETKEAWDMLEINYLHDELEAAKKILAKAEEELAKKIQEYKEAENKCDLVKDEESRITCNNLKNSIQEAINENQETIDKAKVEIKTIEEMIVAYAKPATDYTKEQIDQIRTTLENLIKVYNASHKAYNEALEKYNYAKAHMKDEMRAARDLIDSKKQELEQAEIKYEESKTLLEQELEKNHQKLVDNKKLLKNLSLIKMDINNRTDNYGYSSYNDDISRISGLSTVFPLFFYLVASLVTVSSISRLVKEERKKTGVLKSLGYKDKQIIRKYLYYITSAVLLGSGLGCLIGTILFPKIFSIVYSLVYYLPDLKYEFYLIYIAYGVGLALLSCVFIGYISIIKVLTETPYQLMRVKSDKFSGELFIERFHDLWDSISLRTKLILKNIIKKPIRTFMTIIGVSGCTALIVASFGIRNNISNVIFVQYGKVFDVNSEFFFKNELTEEEKQVEMQKVLELPDVKYVTTINLSSVNVTIPGNIEEMGVYKVVTSDYNNLKKMIHLYDYKTDEPLELSDKGAIITEKLSKMLNLKKGDSLIFNDENDKTFEVKVDGIAKNYIFHYVYMSEALNKKITGEELSNNTLFVKYQNDIDSQSSDKIINSLGGYYGSMSMEEAEKSYNEIMDKFNMVITVIIVFSGMLAFIVLYNLSKINFSERVTEIATLKVLGYKNSEVYKLVNSETTILSFIGMLVGCFIGRILANAVLDMCELDTMMYMRGVSYKVYIISIAITLVFIALINIIVRKDLKRVKMVESLKMVE